MRDIKKVYIEPCSVCNYNCTMCFRRNWIDEKCGFMTNSIFKSALMSIKNIKTVDTVTFAGMGEPLMHKNICGYVKHISDIGKRTEIITNGAYLTPDMSNSLLNAGLNTLWVSVDGITKKQCEKIQTGAHFDTTINNLKYFCKVKKGAKLGITFVMMKENVPSLNHINRFADMLGADMINLSHAIPSMPLEMQDSIYDNNYPVGKFKRYKKNGGMPPKNKCPFIDGGMCFIRYDGEVSPCMQLLRNAYTYLYTEKRKIKFISYGNVLNNTLGEIWNSTSYKTFRQRVEKFEFPDCTLCDGCVDRLTNNTDCMFNTFPTCGACLWAQGIARCP